MTIFYRYEKEDGGGPFFTRDGVNRQTGYICNDDTLNGCLSVEKLDDWFNKRNIDISDYKMVEYVGEPIYRFEDGGCLFRKSSSVKI